MGLPYGPGTAQIVVITAAEKYHVPVDILWGILGRESTFGTNVKTNSKGYTGPFQFGPNEARQYGYPFTNNPNPQQFQQQAEAAAHLVSDRAKQSGGDWNKAVLSYSGGGYNADQARATAKAGPPHTGGVVGALGAAGTGIQGAENAVPNAVGAVGGTVKDIGTVLGDFFNLITSVEFWLRIGEGIAGLVLLAMGFKVLTGISIPTPVGKV